MSSRLTLRLAIQLRKRKSRRETERQTKQLSSWFSVSSAMLFRRVDLLSWPKLDDQTRSLWLERLTSSEDFSRRAKRQSKPPVVLLAFSMDDKTGRRLSSGQFTQLVVVSFLLEPTTANKYTHDGDNRASLPLLLSSTINSLATTAVADSVFPHSAFKPTDTYGHRGGMWCILDETFLNPYSL